VPRGFAQALGQLGALRTNGRELRVNVGQALAALAQPHAALASVGQVLAHERLGCLLDLRQ
jgi:hypothetical protein